MKGCVDYLSNHPTSVVFLVTHDNQLIAFGDESFEFLTDQLFDSRVLAYHGSDV